MESHGKFMTSFWGFHGIQKSMGISWDPKTHVAYQVLFSEIPHMHWIPCEKDKELHILRIPSSFGKAKGCLNGWDRLKAGIGIVLRHCSEGNPGVWTDRDLQDLRKPGREDPTDMSKVYPSPIYKTSERKAGNGPNSSRFKAVLWS